MNDYEEFNDPRIFPEADTPKRTRLLPIILLCFVSGSVLIVLCYVLDGMGRGSKNEKKG